VRLVFDANVLVAAFATRGFCHTVFEHCLENHRLLASRRLLDEVEKALQGKIGVPVGVKEEIMALLLNGMEMAVPIRVDPSVCRDRDDLEVIGLAVAGECDLIVTGDKDLLAVKRFKGIEILTPRQLWDRLRVPS
jgi:putative PIN family toxin of toxin-antitoxin system